MAKFVITRASTFGDDEAPCANCKLLEALSDFPENVDYSIEFKSIDELLDFTKEHGSVIVSGKNYTHDLPSITIYDDYVE